jgi:uncharacterized membrane protein YdbT with pleckstrin-like domain
MNIRSMTPEDYDELVETLSECRYPLPLDEEQIRALANRVRIAEGLRGETVMRQGEESDALYFIISGQLRSADTSGAEPRLLNFHAARTFVGEQGMLVNQPRAATFDVIYDAKLAVWDRSAFNWLLSLDDRLRLYFESLHDRRETRAQRRPFAGKQWDEVTIVREGKHPVMLVIALTGPVLLLLFSLGLLALFLIIDTTLPLLMAVVVGVPLSISLLWGVFNFINWKDDEYIVTSKRVIHIERYVIYGEQRDEAPLIRIQDVRSVQSNLWERILDFYDLIIQTAGAGTILFVGLRDAETVMNAIFEERAKAMERREAADVAEIRKALAGKMRASVGDVALPVDTLPTTTGVYDPGKIRPLPPLIDYLWPRTSIVDGDTITWRKHWVVWLRTTWLALLVFLTLLTLTFLTLLGLPPFGALEGGSLALALVLGLAAIAAFVWYIYLYDGWHRDVYIVTKDRIVDVDSSSFRLQGEDRREGTFEVIQNITYTVPGFFHQLLNMGDVRIDTAAVAGYFTFESVYNPSAVQQEIVNRMVAFQEEQQHRQRVDEDIKLAGWFAEYRNLSNPSS